MKRLMIGFMVLCFPAMAAAAEANLVELHRESKMGNKECLSCHADITKGVSLNKNIKTFHRIHLESKLGTPKNCTDCHSSVDLREDSAGALRKQVDPQLCAGCHSGGVQGAKVLFAK